MNIPRFMIAAGASGSGKTLITCGILQALKNRNYKAASFKCGPDYIDPMFHSKVIGAKSRNLDTFFTKPDITRYLLAKNCADIDIAVMEGVMGYYDGIGGTTTGASAYDLASVTDTPVILIVNCKGMSVSILPYIQGFINYKKESHIQGVILNQMTEMLYPRVKKLIEEELNIPVYGYVPKIVDCVLESRHLGLVMPEEVEGFREKLNVLASMLEGSLEIDQLMKLAQSAPCVDEKEPWKDSEDYEYSLLREQGETVSIGVASDEAFCFFYEDNFELLQKMGAKLIPFSPIHDDMLPQGLDGLLLYGGYPELFAEQLSKNTAMKASIASALDHGLPCAAECGGFMYLHTVMEDMDGREHQMVGAIEGRAYRTPRLGRFGYITLYQEKGSVFGKDVVNIPAHEFHYFDSTACGDDFLAQKPESSRNWKCIHGEDSILAGFPHLYYYGNPQVPKALIEKCYSYKSGKKE